MVNYAESDAEDDNKEEDIFKPVPPSKTRGRALKRRKTSEASDEEEFSQKINADEVVDEGNSVRSYLLTIY